MEQKKKVSAKKTKAVTKETTTKAVKKNYPTRLRESSSIKEELLYYKKCESGDYKKIGERISDIRARLGMTPEEMSTFLGISRAGMFKLEEGELQPSGKILIMLYESFGIDPTYLLLGTSSSCDKILRGLSGMSNSELMDIFIRLQTYFVTGDKGALNGHNKEIFFPDISKEVDGRLVFMTHESDDGKKDTYDPVDMANVTPEVLIKRINECTDKEIKQRYEEILNERRKYNEGFRKKSISIKDALNSMEVSEIEDLFDEDTKRRLYAALNNKLNK